MINDEILNQIFENNFVDIDEKIQKEYHNRLKQINLEKEERENAKMALISELYYKQGFKDGIKYLTKLLYKK